MFLGVLFSIIVSVLFAVYAVPRKFSKQNATLYTMWTGIAYFLGAVVLCSILWGFRIVASENLGSVWHLASITRGAIWVLGTVCFNLAIDKIGLARFNQWKNLQGPVGSILMLTLLTDIAGDKILWVILGIITMLISATLFTIKKDSDNNKSTITGILLAVASAFCFGATAFLNRWITGQGFIYSQLLYHSISVAVFAAIAFLLTAKKSKTPVREILNVNRQTWLPAITGLMFLVATTLSILSYTLIPGAIAWSITQLNALWTILIGVFIFREIRFQKHWLRLTAGLIFAVVAIGFLLLAL
jgi:glucose uptake protein GlcU